MTRYNSLNEHFKNRFGRKVYKLSIDAGFTCPNRDGTLSYDGCIFCSNAGSGDFAQKGESISIQIENAKRLIKSKTKYDCGYIAYFQAFTNTYAPVEQLKKLYLEAINSEDVVALSVATRPDCLSDEVIELLAQINRLKPVTVELGLQTSNENTAKLINRCYANSVFTQAVADLRKVGIEVVVHIIIGLPGETEQDLLNTVNFVSNHGVQGIKLQLLHVLKNTRLAQMEYEPLEMEEYFRLVAMCLEHIPENIVIHRLTGDGNKKELIAPVWSADKHNVLNCMNKYFEQYNIVQGSKFKR